MSENMKSKVIVQNYVNHELTVKSESLEWGKWVQTPVNCAPLHITNLAFYSEGAEGSATGTQGQVNYNIAGVANAVLTINWNVPYSGDNGFSASITPANSGLIATMTGPHRGNDNTFTVNLNNKITE